ncbi:nucleotidyltransferase domain-containing protein [Infirmifilum lucidum]|uniref:Nucleotidyltransferase domain-containing protein n=1 Tax=Infirmifilum lucidum TaxID=2776706 RepID=A0A7L9FHM3_9CREN|nr:nucleotidyltransferase domain-containing protein [Infirmifilum lucidum]QOJ79300.1 nucleotidyltransferase domain-containing protein [Infirmifilum lucidum]
MAGAGEASSVDIGEIWDGSKAVDFAMKFLGELSKHARIRSAVVIGSRARGAWKKWSDIDLVIVSDCKLGEALWSTKGFGVVDARPYTWEELVEGIMRAEVEIIEAFEYGKVLVDDGTWSRARALYEKVRNALGIERYGEGWRIRRKIPKSELEKMLGEIPPGSK